MAVNWSGGLSGAASGGTTGFAIGGPPGAAIGAILGGGLGLFGGKDKQPKIRNQSVLTKAQERGLSNYFSKGINKNPLYQQGSSYLQNLLSGNPEAYQDFEAPYMQNFNEVIAPGIAERFAGVGTGAGGLNSSALANSLAQAGRSLQTDLAGLRSSQQMNAANQALGYAQQPYSNTLAGLGVQGFQNYERPGQPSFMTGIGSGILGSLGQGLGQKGGEYFGNKLFGPAQPSGIGGFGTGTSGISNLQNAVLARSG